jgi:hypothetical protein
MRPTLALAAAVALAVVVPRPAAADPVAVKQGRVTLAVTGLVVDLPRDARKGATWKVSGSWSLSSGGRSFDGRDVVDLEVGGKLVRGGWIHVGYFDAGDCAAVVKTMDVTERWTGEVELYGAHFQVAGGTWDFERELGKVPAIALCAPRPRGQSLLLYHFFLQPGAKAGQAGLKALAKDKLLARVTRAWTAARAAPLAPTHRPEIRRRGEIEAARAVRLGKSELELALPDDGHVWLARTGGDDEASDFPDRMAPSLPDVTLEVARLRSSGCPDVLRGLMESATVVPEPPPLGVPTLWTAHRRSRSTAATSA